MPVLRFSASMPGRARPQRLERGRRQPPRVGASCSSRWIQMTTTCCRSTELTASQSAGVLPLHSAPAVHGEDIAVDPLWLRFEVGDELAIPAILLRVVGVVLVQAL